MTVSSRPARISVCSVFLAVGIAICATGAAPERASAASCANPNWGYSSRWLASTTAPYYTALDYVWPGGAAGRWEVLSGHLNWNYTNNYCGQPDVSPYASWWGGGTCCWAAQPPADGVSYRDVGYIPQGEGPDACGPLSLACAYAYHDPATSYIVETDQRYNSTAGYPWYWGTGSIAGRYDLQSVATHEAGHSLGLIHSNYQPYLVMRKNVPKGSTDRRWLGWGDYTGMQALYP